jgi:colanic acid/amylovoran biosynthesis glycosyltransferase
MKILMYSDKFGGPTTTFIQNDLLELARVHTVKYLCFEKDTVSYFQYPDVEIVPFRRNMVLTKIYWILESKGWYLDYRNRTFASRVHAIIDAFQPDLIQCNFGIEALRLTDNLSENHKKIPLVINFLGYDASFHLRRPSYVRKLIELAARPNVYATCNTYFLRKNLEVKDVDFQRNEVIHTGVRLEFFDRKNVYPVHPEYIFLQIATLSERKGQEVTLRAFKRMLGLVPDPDKYKLILAGGNEDGYGTWVMKLAEELGIAGKVQFTDWISPTDARKLMVDANCFLHHSRTVNGRTEGIPTAVSEAMAMELPVISTWHSGISELVEEGENGFLVEENDIETYSQRMIDIQRFGYLKKNRAKVEGDFNIQTRAEKFEKFYQEIFLRSSTGKQ